MSVKGETRLERYGSSEVLWKWIDAHEQELGIARPYLNRDPPHVGPIDGKEYADKRGRANVRNAARVKKNQVARRNNPPATKRAKPAKPSKVSSL